MNEFEVLAWLVVIFIGVMFLGAVLTVGRTLLIIAWALWRILTYPARVVMRLF